MNRVVLLIALAIALISGIVAVMLKRNKHELANSPPATPPPIAATTNAPAAPPVSVTPVPQPPTTPAETLPIAWEDFRKLREMEQLNRVTTAMENYTLPADVLAFFEKEIFNRQHWDVTRNNMA